MTSQNLLSILAVLLVFSSALTGAVGTVAASPSPTDSLPAVGEVQFQQETPTPDENDTANNSTNNTTSTATPTDTGDFAGTNDSGDSGDSDVQVQVQVGDGSNDSNSSSNESNSSATAGDDEPPFDPADAEHEFNNGILLNELSHNQTHAQFTIYNPTNETHWVVTNNNAGQEPRIKSYELKPGESKNLTTPTTGDLLGWAVSVTSTESIQSIETGAQYNIQHSALVINWNPAGDLGPAIGIVGGVVILLILIGTYKFNHRVGNIAVALAGQSEQRYYQDHDIDGEIPEKSKAKIAKDVLDGYTVLFFVIANWAIGVFAFWDLYPLAFIAQLFSGFGRLFDPATLVTLTEVYSNLMVYWAYNTVILGFVTVGVANYYLKRKGYYLHDIDPVVGDMDFAPWLLSPKRFADMRVFKRMMDDDGNLHIVEIDKKRLLEVNRNSSRRSFAVSEYDPYKNICFVVMEDVDPSALARAEKKFMQAEFFRSIAKAIQDDVWGLVKRQARKLEAVKTARVEGELMEGAEQKDEWMREELAESEYEKVATGEKSVEQELFEQHGEVEGLTDSTSGSSQDSQSAGDGT